MGSALGYLVLAYTISYVSPAPVSNGTGEQPTAEPPWMKEPKGRGSFSIILSSVLTLALCVWTSLHMNVRPNASTFDRVFHKLRYVIIGMLAPEVVLLIAVGQWRNAREFHRDWCAFYEVDPGSRDDNLGLEGAFFVCMGGYSVGPAHLFSTFDNTLTTTGFIGCMKSGLIAKDFVNKRVIVDKGKAEMLGKSLVCVQALWMVVQCIVRKASGLPITLLELHVVMHVICTMVMYACWLRKPLDVNEPIPIVADKNLACLLVVTQGDSMVTVKPIRPISTDDFTDVTPPDGVPTVSEETEGNLRPEFTADAPLLPTPYESVESISLHAPGGPAMQVCIRDKSSGKETPLGGRIEGVHFVGDGIVRYRRRFRTAAVIYNNQFRDKLPPNEAFVEPPASTLVIGGVLEVTGNNYPTYGTIYLDQTDIKSIFSAAEVIRAGHGNGAYLPSEKGTLRSHAKTLSWSQYIYTPDLGNTLLILLIPITYGACHAAAWNTHFPTAIECWLWRASSIIIGFGPCFVLLVIISINQPGSWKICSRIIFFVDKGIAKIGNWTGLWDSDDIIGCTVLFSGFLVLSTSFCRLFLLIESFISLRSLPIGSFASTPWEDYWPHF